MDVYERLERRIRRWFKRNKTGLATFAAGVPVAWWMSRPNVGPYQQYARIADMQGQQLGLTLGASLTGLLTGIGVVGTIWLWRRHRDVAVALIGLGGLYLTIVPGTGMMMPPAGFAAGFVIGLSAATAWWLRGRIRSTTLGSAEWADEDHLRQNGVLADDGLYLGRYAVTDEVTGKPKFAYLRYQGDRHLITVAVTRGGKGVGSIIPNLLTYKGSVLVVDPKGENTLTSILARHKMGQTFHVVDPWALVTPLCNIAQSRFNPLDWLITGDIDINENAMILADSLVIPSGGSNRFWDEEAKALLTGLILHVATDPAEAKNRHLGRVRDLLLMDPEATKLLFEHMLDSDNAVVSGTGARCLQKDEELLASVMASAQAQTHFMDSPRIRESLSASDFSFEDLKARPTSIFLVLPSDRLDTFSRWLRLLIQQAITVNARNILVKPERPVLFMLDEMPALGRLTAVETAYRLMAGYSMQVWSHIQDLSALESVYGKGWQSFVANSGAIQYLGSRDQMTAEYFSKLAGVTTVSTVSRSVSRVISAASGGSSTTTGESVGEAARSLILPDELMTLKRERQLLFVENLNPIAAHRITWYDDPTFAPRGLNLHRKPKSPAPAANPALPSPPSPDRDTTNIHTRTAHPKEEHPFD